MRKTFEEIPIEKRKIRALIGSVCVIIITLAIWGLSDIIEGLMLQMTCTGNISCFIRYIGSYAAVFGFFIGAGFVIYLLYFYLFRWKEVTGVENKRKAKK